MQREVVHVLRYQHVGEQGSSGDASIEGLGALWQGSLQDAVLAAATGIAGTNVLIDEQPGGLVLKLKGDVLSDPVEFLAATPAGGALRINLYDVVG